MYFLMLDILEEVVLIFLFNQKSYKKKLLANTYNVSFSPVFL